MNGGNSSKNDSNPDQGGKVKQTVNSVVEPGEKKD